MFLSQVFSICSIRHSGDLPRSVQRQRHPSKQVWRWKKHVITWLLFFLHSYSWDYSLLSRRMDSGIRESQTKYAKVRDSPVYIDTGERHLASHASRREYTIKCGREKKLIFQNISLRSPFSAPSFKRKRVYIRLLLKPTVLFPSFSFAHSWINRVKDVQKETPQIIVNTDITIKLDVPGVRSTSPAGRSSPSPRLRPPPTGCPAV